MKAAVVHYEVIQCYCYLTYKQLLPTNVNCHRDLELLYTSEINLPFVLAWYMIFLSLTLNFIIAQSCIMMVTRLTFLDIISLFIFYPFSSTNIFIPATQIWGHRRHSKEVNLTWNRSDLLHSFWFIWFLYWFTSLKSLALVQAMSLVERVLTKNILKVALFSLQMIWFNLIVPWSKMHRLKLIDIFP